MELVGWYLLLGVLMLVVTFLDRFVKRLPMTTTIVYLAVGIAMGPFGFEVAHLDPIKSSKLLELITEVAVIVSLFTAGLKLRVGINENRWRVPIRLAFISMILTIGLITLFASTFLGLSLGAAVLLGAIMAPTDPVLASDVQVAHPGDRDRLRFSLSGEAGLNDGTAFPFVMLGLGLLGIHELGSFGWRWWVIDLTWAVAGGLGVGAILGTLVGKLVLWLREKHEETLGRDEFICLGLIAFAYGAALLLNTYGFLAVFAAGLAVRHVERKASASGLPTPSISGQSFRAPENDVTGAPPVQMAKGVLDANEQLERIIEIAMVLILGVMLSARHLSLDALWLSLALFLVIRPLAVYGGTIKSDVTNVQKLLLAWFGIRGIGSLYYLMYAIQKGLSEELAAELTGLVLCLITISIFVHGISVTPIMNFYAKRRRT